MAQQPPIDTIAALATPRGKGAIAILRVSGPQSLDIAQSLWTGNKQVSELEPAKLYNGWLTIDGKKVDQSLIVVSRAPRSYTGEDMVELHTHGSAALTDLVLSALLSCNARLAEPGEFSRRALLNGKLNVAQAEAVADLVEAESKTLIQLAADQLAGGLSNKISALTQDILTLAAHEAASLDFSEEDIADQGNTEIEQALQDIVNRVETMLKSSRNVTVLRDGVVVALAGLPNAGKSTLLNTLVGYERAIVSDVAGTTRDTLDERIMIDEVPVRLIDTAGLNTNPDQVEAIGIQRTLATLKQADIVLVLVEPGRLEQTEHYLQTNHLLKQHNNVITVFTKIDGETQEKKNKHTVPTWAQHSVAIAAKEGRGIPELHRLLAASITQGQHLENASLTTQRQIELVTTARTHLVKAQELLHANEPRDILLVELEMAAKALNQITGIDTNDAMLDDMFSRFCIGK